MQRLLSLKLLSNIPRNPSSRTLISKTNQCYPSPQQLFPAPYTTFSHSWRPQSPGFFSKQLLANTRFRGDLVNHIVGLVRTRSGRRNFHSNFLVGSTRRSWRSGFGRFSTDGVVLGLILTNVAVFLLWRVADSRFMMRNFMISVDNFTSGRIHTLITSAFSHIDSWHLISNMVGFYFFGTSIGRAFGPEFLLKQYLSGAVAGSVFYLLYHAFIVPSLETKSGQVLSIHPSQIPGLGASGAVNAVVLLDIFLFPRRTVWYNLILPVPAILVGIYIIGKDVIRIWKGDTLISGSTHLGGAVMAAFAWARVRRGRF